MSTGAHSPGRGDDKRPAEYRYGVVFVLTLVLVVFVVLAPSATWSRAVTLAIEGVALVFAVATARARRADRRREAEVAALAALAVVIAVAAGLLPRDATLALTGLLGAVIPVALVGGLVRLVRERGVTLQAVAGALAIYLLVGMVFASLIGFVAQVGSTPFFAQGTNGTESDHVYYSFTVLTTTGFGDFAAATHVGRALAVIEMLTGQLYLVTVIGVLIGRRVSTQQP